MRVTREHVNSESNNLKLSAPWVRFGNIVDQIFSKDPEVEVSLEGLEDENENYYITIECSNYSKIVAIKKLLGETKQFGKVSLEIRYTSQDCELGNQTWVEAFSGNPYFSQMIGDYAIFTPDIISFYNDDILAYDGFTDLIVADGIKEIIDCEGVYPCTNNGDLDKPKSSKGSRSKVNARNN